VDIERSLRMAERIPFPKFKIAESGSAALMIFYFLKKWLPGFFLWRKFYESH
jgi:hypothetical protein